MVLDLIREEVLHIQSEDMAKMLKGIDGTTIYAEKMYSTNFTVANKTFCLNLHYNGNNSYLFANGKEIINFKAKDSEIVPYPLCLGGL